MDSCVNALSTVLEVGGHDTALATQACSGLESAFFQQPTSRQLQGTSGLTNTPAVDVLFLFIASVLVFIMQPGFALVSVGCVRFKNAKSILLKGVIDACIGGIVFYFIGFGVAYGRTEGKEGNVFIGSGDWGLENTGRAGIWHRWFFNYAFATAACTIVSGSVAERCKFDAYMAYSVFIVGFMYPVVAHWIWSPDGWLCSWGDKKILGVGAVDYAGCLALHFVGGLTGFVASYILGPRKGRYDEDGYVVDTDRFQGHNQPFVVLGTFLLWVGWYGFNSGSTLSISSPDTMELTTRTAVCTTMGASAAGITTVLWVKWRTGYYDLMALCNGILAGLVGVTAGCALIAPWAAALIGVFSALVFYVAEWAVLHKAKVDDPLSASALHGCVGMFGALMPTLFGREIHLMQAYGWDPATMPTINSAKGIFYGGDGRMLGAMIVGIIVVGAWVGGLSTLFFMTLHRLNRFRVSEEDEEDGLDITTHGGFAYNNRPSMDVQHMGNSRVSPA